MKKWTVWRIFKTIWVTCGLGFLIWNWTTFQSRGLPKGVLESGNGMRVTQNKDQIIFKSDVTTSKLEVIFFQGAMTDPKAYAPLCRSLAQQGFTCHLIKMAGRLPIKDYKKIYRLFDLQAGNYVIGGHSQGGKIAAQVVFENPNVFKGLFLLGTSHPRDISLANHTLPMLKLYAAKDGLASVKEVLANQDKLPTQAELVLIEGGNHSQFGYLGQLFMDERPQISRYEQQKQTLEHLANFLQKISQQLDQIK